MLMAIVPPESDVAGSLFTALELNGRPLLLLYHVNVFAATDAGS